MFDNVFVTGSEYVNASWVCGRRRLREFAVAQHPPAAAAPDLWRLLWDHTAQLVLVLTDMNDPVSITSDYASIYKVPWQWRLLAVYGVHPFGLICDRVERCIRITF